MKNYLRIPTHSKYGWLVFIGLFIVSGLLGSLLGNVIPGTMFIFGSLQLVFVIAFIVEVLASLTGKNKPTN